MPQTTKFPEFQEIGRRPHVIALIFSIQWTIANLVSADRPAKHQKKMSCVAHFF